MTGTGARCIGFAVPPYCHWPWGHWTLPATPSCCLPYLYSVCYTCLLHITPAPCLLHMNAVYYTWTLPATTSCHLPDLQTTCNTAHYVPHICTPFFLHTLLAIPVFFYLHQHMASQTFIMSSIPICCPLQLHSSGYTYALLATSTHYVPYVDAACYT